MLKPEMLCPSWPNKPLGEVVDFLDHLRRPITARDRKPGPYPYYGANGQQDSVAGFIFDEPLILMAEDGGYFDNPSRAIAYRVEGKCWVNNHAHVLRPKPGVDIGFLCRQLEKYDVTRFINGATRQKLNKSIASEIPITLPPLVEQKRIAAILDKADAIRHKRQQAIKHADDFLRATFLDMFGDPVTNPKGWDVVNCEETCERITVGIVVRPASYYKSKGVPALRSLNVRANKVTTENLVYFAQEDNETKLAKTRVWQDDLLLVRSGQPGTAAVVPKELDGVNAIDILIATPNRAKVDPLYLCFYFNSGRGKQMVLGEQRGQIQKHLNVGSLNAAPILLPPLQLQKDFSRCVRKMEDIKKQQTIGSDDLTKLFNSLTQRAFRGEL